MLARSSLSHLPLSFEAVSFHADHRRLIDALSFVIPEGGLTVLLGPNGAGKSLTLRLANGLLKPSSGRVHYAHAIGHGGGQLGHAIVFQKPVMLRRSALANISHALISAGLNRSASEAQAFEALDRFGLADFAHRPARLMSGGEQQRLAIARAVALKPQILFLDEPTSQLDPSAVRLIEAMLLSLKAEGMTLVMSTHDLGQARRLADRVLFLHQGQLLEDSPAASFFAAPQTDKARAFLAGDLIW